MNTIMIYLPIVMAIIGLLFMWIKRSVLKQDAGDGKMKEISDYYEGALAFLKAEYRLLASL
jgi:K(+)-stimulated pyrophosphate-energized sodium pump